VSRFDAECSQLIKWVSSETYCSDQIYSVQLKKPSKLKKNVGIVERIHSSERFKK